MATYDKELCFSWQQALTASAASTDYIAFGAACNANMVPYIEFTVDTTCDSSEEDSTLTIAVQADGDTSFGSATTIWTSEAIAEATLVAGYRRLIPIPFNAVNATDTNLRLYYTVGTHNLTSGKVSAGIIFNPQTNGI